MKNPMNQSRLRIKLEQFRQARRIHGGLLKMSVAALGVRLARMPVPTRRLRESFYRFTFSTKYPPGLAEHEAEKPLGEYRSLNALFTRGLKPGCRPIAYGKQQFLSPCDGTVQEVGRVSAGKILTLKGIEYTLASLLPGMETADYEGGQFAIIFLSPIDCHRVFSPQDAQLEEVIHVPGHRLLVHPPFQRAEFPVYTLNERMILRLSTPLGPCLVVMIAGWGVGNITIPALPEFRGGSKHTRQIFARPPVVPRGGWLATFELGSTVLLLTPPADGATSLISTTDKVHYGQPVFDHGSVG
jgi:phosphatidylserine decarboxylase